MLSAICARPWFLRVELGGGLQGGAGSLVVTAPPGQEPPGTAAGLRRCPVSGAGSARQAVLGGGPRASPRLAQVPWILVSLGGSVSQRGPYELQVRGAERGLREAALEGWAIPLSLG